MSELLLQNPNEMAAYWCLLVFLLIPIIRSLYDWYTNTINIRIGKSDDAKISANAFSIVVGILSVFALFSAGFGLALLVALTIHPQPIYEMINVKLFSFLSLVSCLIFVEMDFIHFKKPGILAYPLCSILYVVSALILASGFTIVRNTEISLSNAMFICSAFSIFLIRFWFLRKGV